MILFLGWIASGLLLALLRGRLAWWERRILIAVTALGALLSVYEVYMSLVWSPKVIAPIRVDLLLVIPFLCISYFGAGMIAVRNVVANRPKASKRIPILVLSAFLFALPTWNIGRILMIFQHGRELTRRFMTREQQLFQARFRDAETYQERFGPVSSTGPVRELSGHWLPGRPLLGITRLVINDSGKLWTFRECGRGQECLRGEGQIKIFDFSTLGKATVEIKADIAFAPLQIERASDGKIRITVTGMKSAESEEFSRKPPPLGPSAQRQVVARPPLVALIPDPENKTLEFIELRRWVEGPEEFALLFHRRVSEDASTAENLKPYLLRGKADSPTTLMQITEVPQSGPVTIELTDATDGARVIVRPIRAATAVDLHPGVFVRDEVLALTPLTNLADVEEWFQTQSVGKFFSAQLR